MSQQRGHKFTGAPFKRGAAVAVAWTVITLVACGHSGPGGTGTGGVAPLPAPSGQPPGTQSTPASAGGQGGPAGVTLPDNATAAEASRIVNAWSSCMEAHGDLDFTTKPGGLMAQTVPADHFPAALPPCGPAGRCRRRPGRFLPPAAHGSSGPRAGPSYASRKVADQRAMAELWNPAAEIRRSAAGFD